MSKAKSALKVAIVHDWLTARGGAEKVVLAIHELYPDAPIYTSAFDPLVLPEFADFDVRTTFIQKLPFFRTHHKFSFLLRSFAFSIMNLSEYDLVITSTTAEAKGVKTKITGSSKFGRRNINVGALHICYCNTPTRYYWSGFDQYLAQPGYGVLNPLARLLLRVFIKPLRWLDLRASRQPDVYIGNSSEVSARIKKYYHRSSHTLFPSVETERFHPKADIKRKGFLVVGRQVPYKRVDLAIEACNTLGVPLIVIGGGTEHERLVAMAGSTIKFVDANDKQLPEYYASAEALIYPAEEDAGIVPVEAMAAGTPVIAYGKGGTLDSIIDGKTGILFDRQDTETLVNALKQFQKKSWNHEQISAHAQTFSKANFQTKLSDIIDAELKTYEKENR